VKDPHKIAFIHCVNDTELYEESIRYIQALSVPAGYEIECIPCYNAPSMTGGYNQALRQSKAKYKVYMHQDVFITNPNFIASILGIFSRNPELGMLGLVGAASVPLNGVWWESTDRYGKVYESHSGIMKELAFQEVSGDYQAVAALDGLILITQYDVPWREDIFTGWHYYDVSQVQEFLRKGFRVGVVNQVEPWVVHDCGIVNVRNQFDEFRKIYLKEYGILPKVSVIIPTYNRPHYFELALQSALGQTYPNIEIIVGDDSTNEETYALIQPYLNANPQIQYFKNEKNLGQFDNSLKCMELSMGEYINFLMDDDLFHPEKIDRMMSYLLDPANSSVTLVTSHRKLIDELGGFLPFEFKSTRRIVQEDTVLDGRWMANLFYRTKDNFIGEPTTVLFKRSALSEPFGTYKGRKSICNVDTATWMNLLQKGNAIYISESLSYFRWHSGQQQQSSHMLIGGACDFAYQVIHAQENGFLEKPSELLEAISAFLKDIQLVEGYLTPEDRRTDLYFEMTGYKNRLFALRDLYRQFV
jgi:glycosyltransferase involved in cell wall biosynthesis